MRQRILEAIYKKIDENPKDINLQRQITLLNKASICTIHAFCLDVIKNNFFEIDTSANFRIGDTAEIDLLKQEVLEDLFEEKYESQDTNFLELVHIYTSYRSDDELKELLLKMYTYMQSMPFPEEWLEEQVQKFNISDDNTKLDFAQTIWGKILLENFEDIVKESELKLRNVQKKLQRFLPETEKFVNTISSDINNVENLQKAIEQGNWDLACDLANVKFSTWPTDKKCTVDYKNDAKDIRDAVKKSIKDSAGKIFIYTSAEALTDIKAMYGSLKNIQKMIIEFSEKFAKSKKERNIIDFNDIEHFALKILIKQENSQITKSEVAKKITEKFEEIAIDEYQDSNMVQEYILNSISNGQNIFMVGDVKQSIYRFRQACPELFLEKYENYKLPDENLENKENQIVIEQIENIKVKDDNKKNGTKIQLFKNFRSRKNILDITNLVFENIMSKEFGDIEYNEDEYLNLGASYPKIEENSIAGTTELHIIDLAEEKPDFDEITIDSQENENNDEENEKEIIENTVLEARFVAKKIKELIQKGYTVYDRKKDEYRKITYKDIVILLRSTASTAPIYEKELQEQEFPVFSDTSTEYLNSVEIQTIMSILKVLDNPLQDIPLVTIMRSPIGNFTDNDLVEIRIADKSDSFYHAMIKSRVSVKTELRNKIDRFLKMLEEWKQKETYQTLDELIWQIYTDTNYYNYVGLLPNGGLKQANLKMLFEKAKQYEKASFKGLFQFINFIEKLNNNSGDMQAAKIIGENENVIRIMSIHKSKGLEFPVVFLCGTSKKFNMQDLNESILMHREIGFGPKYINYERRIEYNTLAKEAIKVKLKTESIAEEMRVLYVALTRAKEKLFITGISKDLHKDLEDKEMLIEMYENTEKMNSSIVKKGKSYLDWLQLVYLKTQRDLKNEQKCIEIYEHKSIENKNVKEEQLKDNVLEELEKIKADSKELEKIEKTLNWEYEYIESTFMPTKTSVTKLKEMQNEKAQKTQVPAKDEQAQERQVSAKDKQAQETKQANIQLQEFTKPKFTSEQNQITSARKGTLMHLCIQKMNEKEQYSEEKINQMIQDLVDREIILEQEAKAINIKKLLEYTKSELWEELKIAKEVHKEQPFYISVPAKDIYGLEKNKDEILVQGIIDLYYINLKGELVLIDYKTDYVENGNNGTELIEKYKTQLQLYKQALEKSLGQKVDKTAIYSVYLNKIIEMKD